MNVSKLYTRERGLIIRTVLARHFIHSILWQRPRYKQLYKSLLSNGSESNGATDKHVTTEMLLEAMLSARSVSSLYKDEQLPLEEILEIIVERIRVQKLEVCSARELQ
jgi:hypothetical protein